MDIFSASSSSLFGTEDFALVNPLESQSYFFTQPQTSQMPSTTHSLLVVDTGVQNYTDLAAGMLPGGSVLFLDPFRDGLTQIDEALSQRQNVSNLYLVSHGGPGYVTLGSSKVDIDVLTGRSSEIQNWAASLTPDADILLYGCNVAAGDVGLEFVQKLNTLTDADVAASNNLTGNSMLGGDWILETSLGNIESPFPFQGQILDNYQATLATTYLSDLPGTITTNGWGPIERDKSNGELAAGDGGLMTLNGVTYTKGLGVHAASDITYTLGGTYNRFIADIGVDDEVGNNGSVIFQVWADGVQIFNSGMMTGSSATQAVDVDVTGRQNLRLVVTDGGNGNAYDHANWANARLEGGSTFKANVSAAPSSYLSDLPGTITTNGWGPIERDKSNGELAAGDGGLMTLNGVTYTKGLGVHAASDITYTLGGTYNRFIADIGVDDEVGNNGSVIFQVWADGVQIFNSGMMTGSSATQAVDVDVTGRQNLRLVVTDGGNGNAYDHANWANARLEGKPASQIVPTVPTGLQNYNLVWADEFNTPGISSPDPNKWGYEKGFIRNNESQYYTTATNPDGSVRLDNAFVSDGALTITAKKEDYPNTAYVQNSTNWKTKDPYARYTSASLTTRFNADKVPSQPGYWQYGYIEMRAKLPTGKGAWPAFWTLGYSLQQKTQTWPASGEIDIMEFVGKNPSTLYSSIWYAVDSATKTNTNTFSTPNPDSLVNDFHTYGIEWTPTSITWYFDGAPKAAFNTENARNSNNYNAFQTPHFLVLNYALGGTFGGPIDDSVLPQKFVVDYVRVFQN